MPKDPLIPVGGAFAADDSCPADLLGADLQSFKRDGFIVINDFVSDEKIRNLKYGFDEALGRKMRGFGIRPVDAPDPLMQDNAGVLNDSLPRAAIMTSTDGTCARTPVRPFGRFPGRGPANDAGPRLPPDSKGARR
jgi:hypothetical protein